jgi:type II restriction enzyme
MPDVILWQEEKNWLVLVESVTSHGPVDSKRYIELSELFASVHADKVFISAFPDKRTFARFAPDVAWETEVWVSDNPTHMVHFNGDKFIGPYKTI